MDEKIVVGLDIGTTKIACFIGMRGSKPDKIKILGASRCPSNGVRYGVVENLQVTAEAIKKAVEDASEKANVTVEEVYIGVAGQHIRTASMESTIDINANEYQLIQDEDLVRLTEQLKRTATIPDGHQIIHIFPQSYSVDGSMLSTDISPVGVSGRVLKGTFNVVSGNSNEIRKLIHSVQLAGYTVKDIILEPVASSYAVLNESDRIDGVALVDIGGGTTDIAVMRDDTIRFSSVIPMAGNVVTNDIAANFKIVPRLAEQLKTKFGSCLPANAKTNSYVCIAGPHGSAGLEVNLHTLAEIIKPRIETIFGMVALDLENSNNLNNLVNGIALTGGGANMKDVRDLAALVTGIHCHIGTPDVHLEPLDNTEEQMKRMEEYNNPMFSTGIGLVIHGLNYEETHPDTEEPEQPEEKPMPEQPPEPIEPNPIDIAPEPQTTVKPKGRRKLWNSISDWLREQIRIPYNDEY
ncbi:MAG: cell division protein FtsA [Bacteroidales bacterium]|nr:cell division protein FtsA [Bacteroidales bacterium]